MLVLILILMVQSLEESIADARHVLETVTQSRRDVSLKISVLLARTLAESVKPVLTPILYSRSKGEWQILNQIWARSESLHFCATRLRQSLLARLIRCRHRKWHEEISSWTLESNPRMRSTIWYSRSTGMGRSRMGGRRPTVIGRFYVSIIADVPVITCKLPEWLFMAKYYSGNVVPNSGFRLKKSNISANSSQYDIGRSWLRYLRWV